MPSKNILLDDVGETREYLNRDSQVGPNLSSLQSLLREHDEGQLPAENV